MKIELGKLRIEWGTDTRSIERPSTPITTEELVKAVGGGTTRAGVLIGESNSQTISAVWCATRVLSEAIASMPLRVRRWTDEGSIEAESHPAYKLLGLQPNEYQTAFRFKEQLMESAVLWGNGYARIVWNGALQPMAFYVLHPERTTPKVLANGRLVYEYRPINGATETYNAEDMIHIVGPGSDGFRGKSVVQLARESLGLTKAAENFGAQFFGSGAQMAGVLKVAGSMEPEARRKLGEQFDAMHSGPNSGKTAVLSHGADYVRIGIPPEDAQFLETRQFQISEISRWFRVPPHMLADLSNAKWSNVEQMSADMLQYTLAPWIERIEQEFQLKLFGPSSLYVDFDESRLRLADVAGRNAYYANGRQWGYLSVNDIRQIEGFNPIAGGDEYLRPGNMAVTGKDSPAPTTTAGVGSTPGSPGTANVGANERALLRSIVTRLAQSEVVIREANDDKRLQRHAEHIRERLADYLTETQCRAVSHRMLLSHDQTNPIAAVEADVDHILQVKHGPHD
jgi:HK97 family phage portal protein